MKQHEQVIMLVASLNHVMLDVPLADMEHFRKALLDDVKKQAPDLCNRLDQTGQMSDDDCNEMLRLSQNFLNRYQKAAAEKCGE